MCCCSGCVDALHFSPIDWSDGGGGVPGARSPLNDLTGLVFLRYRLLCSPAAPPQAPAEDVDRYRRRFNMRMLVPGRPVKETPATPPPVPMERPTYREKFIPPELSMWDYFVAKVSKSAASAASSGRGAMTNARHCGASFALLWSLFPPSALPAPVGQQRSVRLGRERRRGRRRRRRRLPL